MQGLALLLYGAFAVVYWLLAIFVVYHIRKYMLDRILGGMLIIVFLGGMVLFFVINFGFFLSIPMGDMPSSDWITR